MLGLALLPLALLIHEAGHFSAARAFGYRPRLVLHKLGVGTAWGDANVPAGTRAIVTAAGPFFSSVAAVACWHMGLELLAFANAELCVLNLLPIPHSDGRRIVSALKAL